MSTAWYSKQGRIVRKVTCCAELEEIISHLRSCLKTSPLERQWHIHRALNAFRYFQPVIHNTIWIDKMPPSFCFEDYEFDNVIYIEVCFVDPDAYSLEEAAATLLNWLSLQDKEKQIFFTSLPECLYKEGIFSEFEILFHSKYPCYWITDRVSFTSMPSGFREAVLHSSDVRRVVDPWSNSYGEVTVQLFQKLWSSGVNSYEVLTENNESVAQYLWNRGIMENLSVDEKYRGLGIGKALQKSFINKLFDLECRPLLETEIENTIARDMFEKIGFVCPTFSYYITMRRRT